MIRKFDLFQAVVAILVTISLPSAAGAQSEAAF